MQKWVKKGVKNIARFAGCAKNQNCQLIVQVNIQSCHIRYPWLVSELRYRQQEDKSSDQYNLKILI